MSGAAESLLQQFIPEARDLLDQAGRSLLALERNRTDAEPMNELFRAVHTLKGTSGLFDIAPLTGVVHAAEDLLCAVQNREIELAPTLADLLLEAFDGVGTWIDALAATGELPATAEAIAAGMVTHLRAPLPAQTAQPTVLAVLAPPIWTDSLTLAERQACADAKAPLLAISYTPDPDCFFRGEDPLALIRQVDGLRVLRAEPVETWPGLDAIDPFRCNLRFSAIATASRGEIEHLFRYVDGQVEIASLASAPPVLAVADAEDPLPFVLDGQRRLLMAADDTVPWPARARAAARVLNSVLHSVGRGAVADGLDAALQQALESGEPTALLAVIDAVVAHPAAPPVQMLAAPAEAAIGEHRPGAPTTLRVEQSKIDALMKLIGELVVAKNALAYLARRADQGTLTVRELAREIKDRHALVNRIAEEMQGAVMAVRMLPVDHVFQRFPRLVRDIARRLGKQVELVLEGGETEADKNVIEVLADPLIHILRNSLDHGIESPQERCDAGKSGHGTIRLQAMHDSDRVLIRITDDGRGIDPAIVRAKAVAKGLIDADRAEALSDEDATMLVFAPGFSTAAAVSDLSGRGVGMDVVRTAIEKAGGQVSLSSRPGQGTTLELSLPLSMAVSRIMTIACGERLFGVPMGIVVETVRIPRRSLHSLRNREAFVLRESVVPVIRLGNLLDLPEAATSHAEEAILVVRVNGERLGIVVDSFRDGMEVIVRPMEGVLAGLRGFAGTTLLGDGRVLLILDLAELVT